MLSQSCTTSNSRLAPHTHAHTEMRAHTHLCTETHARRQTSARDAHTDTRAHRDANADTRVHTVTRAHTDTRARTGLPRASSDSSSLGVPAQPRAPGSLTDCISRGDPGRVPPEPRPRTQTATADPEARSPQPGEGTRTQSSLRHRVLQEKQPGTPTTVDRARGGHKPKLGSSRHRQRRVLKRPCTQSPRHQGLCQSTNSGRW